MHAPLKRSLALAAVWILGTLSAAHAGSIESDTVARSGIFNEDLLYQDRSEVLKDTGYGSEWKVDAGYARAVDQLSVQQHIVDTGHNFTGTLGEVRGRTRFGASYLFSDTRSVNLTEQGPTFYVGEEWNRSGPGPSWNLKARYGVIHYRVDNAGVVGLQQSEFHLAETVAWPEISFYVGYGHYHYDRPAGRFLAAVTSNKALGVTLAGLRYALYGFAQQSTEVSATWTPKGPWQATIEEAVSNVVAPVGTVYATQLLVSRQWRVWTVGVGAEHDRNVQFTDNLGLVNLSYHFDS